MVFGDPSYRVLLLDDDIAFLKTFEDLLTQDGHFVYPATCGLEALEIVCRVPIDISFLDVDLPDLDGIEIYKRMHRQRPTLPAIFVSGDPCSKLEETVLGVGGLALLRKPLDPRAVRDVMHEAFHKHSSGS